MALLLRNSPARESEGTAGWRPGTSEPQAGESGHVPDVRTPQDAKGPGKFGMATLERHNEEDAWGMKDKEPTPTAHAEASQPRRRENRVCTLRATERHGSRDGDVAVGAANQNRVRVSERAD